MNLETDYWRLFENERELCLSCELAQCIWDMAKPDYSLCPVEQLNHAGVRSPVWEANRTQIAAILQQADEGLPITRLSRLCGVGHQTLLKWIHKGYLESAIETRRRRRPRYLVLAVR